MPAADPDRSLPAPQLMLWAAVALAPVAAGLLIVGGSGGLFRVGALLAMVAVVLVAVGALLSGGAGRGGSRGGIEAFVTDEVETLRDDIRGDITHAAKATHRAVSEKIEALSDTVEALRGQIEVLRAHVERSHLTAAPHPGQGAAAGAPGVPGGVLRHTETVQVTTRQTTLLDAEAGAGYGDRGAVYGSAAPVPGPIPGQRRADRSDAGDQPDPTRRGYAARAARGQEVPPAGHAASAGRAARGEMPVGGVDRAGWSGRHGGRTEQRMGDRWASTRSDAHGGRETHVGERSAELRSDASATELHVQDRWSSTVQRAPEQSTGGRRRRDGDDAGFPSGRSPEITQGVPGRRGTEWRDRTGDLRDPRTGDPRTGDPRTGDPRTGDPRGADPRAGDLRPVTQRAADSRLTDPRTGDPRTGDPRAADPASGGWTGGRWADRTGAPRREQHAPREQQGNREQHGPREQHAPREQQGNREQYGPREQHDYLEGYDGAAGRPTTRPALPAAPSGEPAPTWAARASARVSPDQGRGTDDAHREAGYGRAPGGPVEPVRGGAESGGGRAQEHIQYGRVPTGATEYGRSRPADGEPTTSWRSRRDR